jgi:Rha family phage regulatory protein
MKAALIQARRYAWPANAAASGPILPSSLPGGHKGRGFFNSLRIGEITMKTRNKTNTALVEIREGNLWTTSLLVAGKFLKRHDNVLQKIERILDGNERARLHFKDSTYISGDNIATKMYLIDRDGFFFLSMGFTGAEADKWKWEFIDCFNAMASELERLRDMRSDGLWLEARELGKQARLAATDTVKEFVEYATLQGSKSAKMYYMNITKGTYSALFTLEHGGKWEGIRDCLSKLQLTTLASAEQIALKALREAMEMDMHYKDAYKYAVGKVKGFADLIGTTKIPDEAPLKLVKST